MNVNFIPIYSSEISIQVYMGSSVQSGMKNGMNSIRNELQLNPDSCKQIWLNPLWSQQKRNEFDPDWNSIRIHVNTPLQKQLAHV